jgi:hypothetical protein
MIPLTSMYPSFPISIVPSSHTLFSRRPEPRRCNIRFLHNHCGELTTLLLLRSSLPPLSTFTSSPHPMRSTCSGRDSSLSLLALARQPLRPTRRSPVAGTGKQMAWSTGSLNIPSGAVPPPSCLSSGSTTSPSANSTSVASSSRSIPGTSSGDGSADERRTLCQLPVWFHDHRRYD